MLLRVQTTPKLSLGSRTSVTITFTNTPAVGNGIIVPVVTWGNAVGTWTLRDNQGNLGELAVRRVGGDGKTVCTILYISRLLKVDGQYAVTIDFGNISTYSVSCAMEVSGVSYGLGHHVVASQASVAENTAPSTGVSPLSQQNDLFVVALVGSSRAQTSITVESVSVPWAQEFEELPSTFATGEADSRVLGGQFADEQSCSWSFGTASHWAAVLATFIAASTAPPGRVTQDVVELLSQPTPALRVTQDTIEVLSLPSASVCISQYAVETLVLVTADARLTQYAVETLTSLTIAVPPEVPPGGGGETSHPFFS
jgi:hypothetical protein